MRTLLLVALIAVAVAADPPAPPAAGAEAARAAGAAPVAVVDGRAITLREVEDALVKREGADLVEELVHAQLERTDWSAMADDAVVLEVAGVRLRRGMLAAQLLRQKAAPVREELINIAIVEAALAKEAIVVGDAEIAAETARMQRKLDQGLEQRAGGARMSLDDYIRQSQKVGLADFVKQPGFRMGAGLHALAEKRIRVEAGDEVVRAWFEKHRADYDQREGVELSLIAIPYQTAQVLGAQVVTEAEKQRLMEVMVHLRESIVGGVTFANSWHLFGRGWDPQAAPDGRVGWIGRDGARGQKGAPTVPAPVVEAVFAAQGTYPILLQPIAYDTGVALALVHGKRAAKAAEFADVREKVLTDLVDQAIEGRTQRLLADLREHAQIDYQSLPPLVEERERSAGLKPGDAMEGEAVGPQVAPEAAPAER